MPSLLLIDDEAALCRSLARLLRWHGIAVSTHTDPVAFMKAAAAYRHDALLADWNLRSCEGTELFARLRAAGDRRPFALISGRLTDEHGWALARAAGVDVYIRRDLEPSQLVMEVAALCARPARSPMPHGVPARLRQGRSGTLAQDLQVIDCRLVRGSTSLPLTVHLRKLALLLLRVQGAVVDHATIGEEIYGRRVVDEALRHRIWQLVHVLRSKGAALGFTIRSIRGQGYAIEDAA